MNVGYEEKTFETYFNIELYSHGFVFPFGQAQEGILGTDASVDLNIHSALWKILNNQPINSTISLADIEKHLNKKANSALSSIKANILFQYKKPEWVTTANGSEWQHWNQPYFRYALRYSLTQKQKQNNKKEQLDILLDLENQFGNQALVLYASPALENLPQLVHAYKNGNIIQSTNFVRLSLLNKKHKHITYTQPGTRFKAHSEVEIVEHQTLAQHIARIEMNQESNADKITFFAQKIADFITNLPSDTDLKQAFNSRMAMFEAEIKNYPLLSALTTLKAFTEITAMDWVIATNNTHLD